MKEKHENVIRFIYWGREYVGIVTYYGSLAQSFNADLINFGIELANVKPCQDNERFIKWVEEWFRDKSYEIYMMK